MMVKPEGMTDKIQISSEPDVKIRGSTHLVNALLMKLLNIGIFYSQCFYFVGIGTQAWSIHRIDK